jgi:hypothetical protein
MTGVTISLGTRVGVPNLSAERVPRRTPRGDSVRVAWGLVTFRTAVSAGDVVLPGGCHASDGLYKPAASAVWAPRSVVMSGVGARCGTIASSRTNDRGVA